MWSPWKTLGGVFVGAAMLLGGPAGAVAAELPAHDPLSILIVSDEANPWMLSDADLTQPGEMGEAIETPGSGLNVAALQEVSSECVDDALDMLAQGVDVVVYYAHLSATACDGSPRQVELTTAIEQHLRAGGGVVVFHHGLYEDAGKEPILQLLGGRSSSIAWDTGSGQDVIAVGGDHFVTSQGMQYSGTRSFGGAGVAMGEFSFFNNTPDERYDATEMLTAAGEQRTILFASADGAGGSARVLGYDLTRPDWMGHVVWYQPGEYQPNSMDVNGNNFQALANAIVYVATTQEEGGGTTGSDSGGPSDGTTGDDSSSVSEVGGPASMDNGNDSTDGGTGGGTATGAAGGDDAGGCGCRSTGSPAGALGFVLVGLAGLGLRRRR